MPRPGTHKSAKTSKRPDRAAAPQLQLPAMFAAVSPTPSAQIDALTDDPDFMTSLAPGFAVIQAFSQKKQQLTISQVSNKTGISRAADRRCLFTLAKLGFAGSDGSRHFFLPPRVLALGHSYISSMRLATPRRHRHTSRRHPIARAPPLESELRHRFSLYRRGQGIAALLEIPR